jgi:hypothetical protein
MLIDKLAQQRAEQAVQEERLRSERLAEAERQKLIDQEKAKEAADAARAADVEHRRKINWAALNALMEEVMIDQVAAKEVLKAIIAGKIPNVAIRY